MANAATPLMVLSRAVFASLFILNFISSREEWQKDGLLKLVVQIDCFFLCPILTLETGHQISGDRAEESDGIGAVVRTEAVRFIVRIRW